MLLKRDDKEESREPKYGGVSPQEFGACGNLCVKVSGKPSCTNPSRRADRVDGYINRNRACSVAVTAKAFSKVICPRGSACKFLVSNSCFKMHYGETITSFEDLENVSSVNPKKSKMKWSDSSVARETVQEKNVIGAAAKKKKVNDGSESAGICGSCQKLINDFATRQLGISVICKNSGCTLENKVANYYGVCMGKKMKMRENGRKNASRTRSTRNGMRREKKFTLI